MTDTRRENDMVKKSGKKALTNAQRQSRYRERKKLLGLKRQDMWADNSGSWKKLLHREHGLRWN
jgi:hypothetical protein